MRQQLDLAEQPAGLVDSASRLLSSLTHLAGVVMVPKHNQVRVKQIEFIPLSDTRVLTVLVTSAGEVFNRIIQTSRVFSRSELEQLSNYVTDQYGGNDLQSIRSQVLREMQETKRHLDALMVQALEFASAAFARPSDRRRASVSSCTALASRSRSSSAIRSYSSEPGRMPVYASEGLISSMYSTCSVSCTILAISLGERTLPRVWFWIKTGTSTTSEMPW